MTKLSLPVSGVLPHTLNACSTQESQTDAGAPPLKKAKTENGAVPAGGDAAEGTTVFVGGCSYDADEAAFRDFFKDCGEIKTVRIPTFQDSGKPRGIAFIEFDSAEAAQKACEFNDAEMMGRYLKVSVSTSTNKGNQDRAPRSQELSAKPEGRLAVLRCIADSHVWCCVGCKTVFVGNLSWQATEEDLRAAFESCGAISNVRIAMDRDSGKSKG